MKNAISSYAKVALLLTLFTVNFTMVHAADIKNSVKHVNAQEAHNLLNSEKTIQVLDVRTAREFQQGHLEGAINIDYYADDFADQLKALDPNTEYLVHCRSGVRSGKSLAILKSAGIKKLIHLDGGIKAWLSKDLPLN